MNKLNIKSATQVEIMLKEYGFQDILLEDNSYQILSETFFEPSLFRKIAGLAIWAFTLGGSDCGKFSVRYAAELMKKYADSENVDLYQGGEMPAMLLGFAKYQRRDGAWHIVCSTIVNHGGNYVPVFFERTSRTFQWIVLNEQEKRTLRYFHAY